MIQCSLSKSLGLTYKSLPPELLDAFNHDPAIVSGTTPRFQGWRAVEDTHRRLARQREIFQTFLSTTANTSVFSPPGSVLHEHITTLLQSLEALEGLKEDIAVKTMEVAEALEKVKTVHATVKKEYNETLSHTSVMYSEVRFITFSLVIVRLLTEHFLAHTNCSIGRKLQRSIPAVLGVWPRCADDSTGYCDSVLETLREDYRRRCARLSCHTVVPQRVHWRNQEISD
jgi:hypothetical protein